MSNWSSYDIEKRLRRIMGSETYSVKPEHHFGRPSLSSYQLAIEFDKLYHNDVVNMGYVIGGRGVNVKTSLAQYLARELSRKIKDGIITDIEGSFLSNTDLEKIEFKGKIVSSSTGGSYDLALFKIIDTTMLIEDAINDGFGRDKIISLFHVTEEQVEEVQNTLCNRSSL